MVGLAVVNKPSFSSLTLRGERSENLICWDSCDQLGIYQLYLELISKICGDWSLAGGILSCPIISFISKHVFCNIGILNKTQSPTEWEINLWSIIHHQPDIDL